MPETITIPARVRKLIAETLRIEPERVTDEARFEEDLGADSMDLFDVIASIEDDFDIIVSLPEQNRLRAVGDVIRTVEAQR